MKTPFKRWQIVEVRNFPDKKWVKAYYMEKTDDERYRAWEILKSEPRKWKNCRPVIEGNTGDKEYKLIKKYMKTFEPNKTITELWIDTKRKFVVVHWDYDFEEWEVLTLKKDDGSTNPEFENRIWKRRYASLSRLAYYKTPKEEMKEWDYVYISSESEEHAIEEKDKRMLLRKCINWYVCIQYGFEKEYLKWEAFETTIWDYAVPVPATKTITLEVTEEQEREINNILKK